MGDSVKEICKKIHLEWQKKKEMDVNALKELYIQLNGTILELNQIPYYKSDLLAFYNRKNSKTEIAKMKAANAWSAFMKCKVVFACQISLQINSMIYFSLGQNSIVWLLVELFFFIIFAMSYVILIRHLEIKRLTFLVCLRHNVYLDFDKNKWKYYGIYFLTLMMLIWWSSYDSQLSKVFFFTSIIAPFAGICGSFFINVVGFKSIVCSSYELVNFKKDEFNNGLKLVFISEKEFTYKCFTYYKSIDGLDRDLWKFVFIPLVVLKKEVKVSNVGFFESQKLMNEVVFVYDTDRQENVKDTANLSK